MKLYSAFIALVLLFVPLTVPATGISEISEPESEETLGTLLPFDSSVRRGRLPNGLTYYVRENDEPEDRAFLRLVVNAGSVLEDDDQLGLAHFAEHMAFNGTEDFDADEIVAYLESLGMRFGPDVNAYTSFEETVYRLQVQTDQPGKLRSGFHILEQWAHEILFQEEEIDKERGVIYEEWRQGRGAAARMQDEWFPVLFAGSRYAERLPIGDPELILSFEPEAIRRFYDDWYRPELMAVVAVGDFDADEVVEMIADQFDAVSRRENPRPRPTFGVPDHEETLVAVASDPEAAGTRVSVYVKGTAQELNTVRDYRELLSHNLFSIMLNSRLDERSREEDAPFLNAGAGRAGLVRTTETTVLTAETRDDQIAAGLTALITETRRVAEHGFLDAELERARRRLLRGYEQAYLERENSPSSGFAAEYTRHYLEGEAAPGIAFEYELAKALIPTITIEEFRKMAEDYLGPENRVVTVTTVKREGTTPPSESDIRQTLARAESMPVEAYEEAVADRALMAEMPEPGRIENRRELPDVDAVEWQLSNGARVVVKQTDFRADEVLMNAYSPGGSSKATDDEYLSAIYATEIVMESGLGDFSASDLEKLLAGNTAAVEPYIGELTEGIEGSAGQEDLETLFQLTHLAMTDPRRDSVAFTRVVERLRVELRNEIEEPQTQFISTLREILFQDHPRRRQLTPEDVERIDLDAALSFYRERFADPSDFTFFFVGSASPETLEPFVTRYLASIPAVNRNESWEDIGVETPEGVVDRDVYAGIEPISRVGIVFHGEYDWGRENNYRLRSTADLLGRRLREVIREEEGGTYGIGAWASVRRHPDPLYTVFITFSTDPDRAEELTDRVMGVVEEVTAGDISRELVERVRTTQLAEFESGRRTNGFWLNALWESYFYDLDPAVVLDYPDLVEDFTPTVVRETAVRYFDTDRMVTVILYPAEAASLDDERSATRASVMALESSNSVR
ncbi:MAG: M16 family metallopeptidase [Spirochaetaceae bacterium]